jgi:hypothetical protein
MDQNNSSAKSGSDEVKPQPQARDRWQAIIDEHRESGLGVAAFCRQKEIPSSSFYGWRQKLCGPAQSSVASSAGRGRRAFVPVRVTAAVAGGMKSVSASPAGDCGEALELCLPGERRLLLRSGFDPALLRQALLALESLTSAGRVTGREPA